MSPDPRRAGSTRPTPCSRRHDAAALERARGGARRRRRTRPSAPRLEQARAAVAARRATAATPTGSRRSRCSGPAAAATRWPLLDGAAAASPAPDRRAATAARAPSDPVERSPGGTRRRTSVYGISLGSVLLLAAIGLAITFGVMGVINMAHGELVMLGAYTTFVVQEAMPRLAPRAVRLVAGRSPCRWPSWSRAPSASPSSAASSASSTAGRWRPCSRPGASPGPAAGGAHDLRPDQPRRSATRLDVGRLRASAQLHRHLQPPVDHRLRARRVRRAARCSCSARRSGCRCAR